MCDHGSEVLVRSPEWQGSSINTLETNVEKKKDRYYQHESPALLAI